MFSARRHHRSLRFRVRPTSAAGYRSTTVQRRLSCARPRIQPYRRSVDLATRGAITANSQPSAPPPGEQTTPQQDSRPLDHLGAIIASSGSSSASIASATFGRPSSATARGGEHAFIEQSTSQAPPDNCREQHQGADSLRSAEESESRPAPVGDRSGVVEVLVLLDHRKSSRRREEMGDGRGLRRPPRMSKPQRRAFGGSLTVTYHIKFSSETEALPIEPCSAAKVIGGPNTSRRRVHRGPCLSPRGAAA